MRVIVLMCDPAGEARLALTARCGAVVRFYLTTTANTTFDIVLAVRPRVPAFATTCAEVAQERTRRGDRGTPARALRAPTTVSSVHWNLLDAFHSRAGDGVTTVIP
jgi:hypothetical protein